MTAMRTHDVRLAYRPPWFWCMPFVRRSARGGCGRGGAFQLSGSRALQ